jgi:hypothetical protein
VSKTDELREIISEMRRLSERLEGLLKKDTSWLTEDALSTFDPDIDEPPVRPRVNGDEVAKDWCGLMLWAQLQAINVRQHRGATAGEVVQIAERAGYRDGRGWNRWGGWENHNGARWVTPVGLLHLRTYYQRVGRRLPDDFDQVVRP